MYFYVNYLSKPHLSVYGFGEYKFGDSGLGMKSLISTNFRNKTIETKVEGTISSIKVRI